ncbi:UTP--GlnB (protein PII) uridylyltransferase GlnD [Roseibium hamelinense]|uniref:Bifunctional uridylyltransferase/uridylyl-removing enzyme n=1 Tax=Roseibium hamelinense TaxID=150831 RepID=A0A562SP12_9HYPH|nr:[protein-PII] uridylyltransferase [Roseibium hamelinense]MTI44340.1 [protein-PII] uridylyltransferase [Roseibium hamelinense]TWI82883.1 UTP--GlnB (protein PII) uridylyltransferase GlnD [Roseibium hamelinense]
MRLTQEDIAGIIDADALRKELTGFTSAAEGDGSDAKTRAKVLNALKKAMKDGRAEVRKRLEADGGGLKCAWRLSFLQDELIRVIYDFAFYHVYRIKNPSAAERLSVVAVGGYGRGTLAPGSDVDLLFLLPYKQTPWGEQIVEYILYMLWDLGLKVGHATRNIEECVRLSRSDMTIRTAVLEARYIWGDEPLYEELVERFCKDVVAGTSSDFIAAKLKERDERHRRQGTSRYLVEPNIKEGKGGLRDLNTLFWIAKYHFQVRSQAELVKKGVLSRSEYQRFMKSEDFLWAVRCHLHFLTGRPEERLSFDVQREIAILLGYTQHPGMKDVERFMKHYFLVAKDVGDLTRILCAALEEEHVKDARETGLTGLVRRLRPGFGNGRVKPVDGATGFVVENGRLNVTSDTVFENDPANLLRVFQIADKLGINLHPHMTKLIRRSLRLIDGTLRSDPEANRLFLTVLTSRHTPEKTLRKMNETGVLGRFVPEFGKVVAMMQFNMYHHYTVDEHLIRSIGVLAEIERGDGGDDHPLATELIRTLQNRRVLYVAMFLHDIAKGRPEDHSIAGARIARKICPRFGLNGAETETVAWLIEHHLDMSTIAQSRDLSDQKTITDFAHVVQSMERLKLLLILTVADIRAVGPGVFNGWKGQLLRTLYYECEPHLTGGHTKVPRRQTIEHAKQELAGQLHHWPEDKREEYVDRHYAAYWLRVAPDRRLAHAEMIRKADTSGDRLAFEVTPHEFEAVTEVTVLAPDHPRLLSIVAGACHITGANIVDAQIDTTTDGFAIDTIFISRELPDDSDERRRGQRITEVIEKTLAGETGQPEPVSKKTALKGRMKAFKVEPEVLVHNSWSDEYTVLEISGLDRPGLLYDLTRSIATLNLNIASAHISTFGERVVDVFYVTDLTGQKIANIGRQEIIRERLAAAVDGYVDMSPAAPVARQAS